jgi:hypothetical protein
MRRNRSGLPEHCSRHPDRHRKLRVRFRWRGFSTYLKGEPWSDDFMRQYAAALEGVKAQAAEIGASRTLPGSINALVVSYYKLVFPRLKASTQAVRRNILERFRAEHGNNPVRLLRRDHVDAIITAKKETPEAANNLRKVQVAERRSPPLDRGRSRTVPSASSARQQAPSRAGIVPHRPAPRRRRAHGLAAY